MHDGIKFALQLMAHFSVHHIQLHIEKGMAFMCVHNYVDAHVVVSGDSGH